MKGKYLRTYTSKKGNPVFVYAVSGTKEQIEAFEKAQGDNLRHDEKTGTPLLFAPRYGGNNVELITTQKGETIIDMSKFRQAASLADQFSNSKLGDAIANQAATMLLGSAFGNAPVAAPAVASEIEKAAE